MRTAFIAAMSKKVIVVLLIVRVTSTIIHRPKLIPNCITAITIVWLVNWNTTNSKSNQASTSALSNAFFLSKQCRCFNMVVLVALRTFEEPNNRAFRESEAVVTSSNHSARSHTPCVMVRNTTEGELLSDNSIVCSSLHQWPWCTASQFSNTRHHSLHGLFEVISEDTLKLTSNRVDSHSWVTTVPVAVVRINKVSDPSGSGVGILTSSIL